jgi:hypothetical protein
MQVAGPPVVVELPPDEPPPVQDLGVGFGTVPQMGMTPASRIGGGVRQFSRSMVCWWHPGKSIAWSVVQTIGLEIPHLRKESRYAMQRGFVYRVALHSEAHVGGTAAGHVVIAREQNWAQSGSSVGKAPPAPLPTLPAKPPVPDVATEVVVPVAPVPLVTVKPVDVAVELEEVGPPGPEVPPDVAPPAPESPGNATLPPHAIASPATTSQLLLMGRPRRESIPPVARRRDDR